MKKKKTPATAAIRALHEHAVPFTEYRYNYQPQGGTTLGAQLLNISEHLLIKTLIMENEQRSPLIVLMHGDRQVSTKALARVLQTKTIQPCEPHIANKHSGYQIGGTSPFGTRRVMPIYMQQSILEEPEVYINGGRRGLLLKLRSVDIQRVLQPKLVDVAV